MAGTTSTHTSRVSFEASAEGSFLARANGILVRLDGDGARLQSAQGSATWHLAGHRPAPLSAEDALSGTASHLHGTAPARWIIGQPLYGAVRQRGVYPGIDLLYHASDRALEYDFVVAPHAMPNQIRMRFTGTARPCLDEAGNLLLRTGHGELLQHKPVAYQTLAGKRREVAANFKIAGNGEVGFAIGNYDRSAQLVIDPVLTYSSFVGGAGSDQANAIAVDASGNWYITGQTPSSRGDADVLVRKYSPTGAQLWSADMGGAGVDQGTSIQVGADNSVFVAGFTASTDFPVNNAFQRSSGGGANDAFIMRLDATGRNLIYSTYFGGSGDDRAYGIAVDSSGSAYVTGSSDSTNFPTNQNGFQTSNRGGTDAYAAKFNANGSQAYTTLIGGGSNDIGYAIAVDPAGNAYLTGVTESDSFPQLNNPYQRSRHGGRDASSQQ